MYKIVSTKNGKLRSIIGDNLSLDVMVEYKVGEFVYPEIKGTKLFVFKTIKDVDNFIKDQLIINEYAIYKCDTLNAKAYDGCILQLNCFSRGTLEAITAFWNDCFGLARNCPDGTYLCDAVKLTERIYLND